MGWILKMLGRGVAGARHALARHADYPALRPRGVASESDCLAAWHAERAGRAREALRLYRRVIALGGAPDWVHDRAAALGLVLGDPADAIACLKAAPDPGPFGPFFYAALLHAAGRRRQARHLLHRAITYLLCTPEEEPFMAHHPRHRSLRRESPHDDVLSRLVERGNRFLNSGRYILAGQVFEQAMGMADLLMVAHGSWLMAERAGGDEGVPAQLADTLISLARLSDQLLKCQARARLAAHLAEELRKRHVRDDLAAWATGSREIARLLQAEEERLARLLRRFPKHTEMHYRLGLLARARGEPTLAEREFRRVLAVAPHHAESAVRLAATLLEQGQTAEAALLLENVEQIDMTELWQYYQLAMAVEDPEKFEQVLAAMEQRLGPEAALRPNLAFALGEMGLSTDRTDVWRDAAVPDAPLYPPVEPHP